MERPQLVTAPSPIDTVSGERPETARCAEALTQTGAALRHRHFENPQRRPGHWLRHALLWWTACRPHNSLARLSARLHRSLCKRAEAIRALLKVGTPIPLPPQCTVPQPPLLFDPHYYKDQWPTQRRLKVSWWDDYLTLGWKYDLNPHPLFDVRWYLETNPDVQAAGVEPLTHFLNTGWEEGRDPNPYFQTDWYIAQNPELLAQNLNPLLHYLEVGWKNGRDPGPRFSIEHYFAHVPPASRTVEPLGEWIQEIAEERGCDRRREYVEWPITYVPTNPQPVRHFGKIAVQLHAFYLDQLDLLLEHLRYLPCRFDLLVSTDTPEHARQIEAQVARSGLDCGLDVRYAQNRGRDIAPLVCLFGRKLLGYDYALHIHTKKSLAVKADPNYGHQWLMHNLGFLLSDADYVQGVFSLFENHPNCGVLAPKPWRKVRRGMSWTSNRPHAETLMKRLHLPPTVLKTQPLMFPSGTMFWFRPAALKPLLASDLEFDDFPPEPLPNDGTLAHAIERSILYIALSQGYHSLVISPAFYQSVC